MIYSNFAKLYMQAEKYSDLDLFISGIRDQSKGVNAADLERIFNLSQSNIAQLRQLLPIKSRAEMSRQYRIPIRTIEDWDAGTRQIAIYVKMLIAYTVFCNE